MTLATPTFHFFTLVTRSEQYDAMRASLAQVGFDETNALFTVLDNREGNAHEPYSAITRAVAEAQAPYVVFCHQDLLFQKGPDDLRAALAAVDAIDPTWAVAGNAGGTPEGDLIFCIDDHSGSHDQGVRPGKVLTLDENFLVIRRDAGVGCSPELSGFHLYGTDLCLNAYAEGHSAYVVEYRLKHASSSLDYGGMFRIAKGFERVWRRRVGGAVLQTAAMVVVLTRNPVLYAVLVYGRIARKLWGKADAIRRLNQLMRSKRPAWLPMS